MRTSSHRPIATTLVLLGAMTLFAGCGDQGDYLSASLSGSSSAYIGATGDERPIDDPVLAGYDGVDSTTGLGIDDPYSRAVADWNETEGSLGGLDDIGIDEFGDDDLMPVGYGADAYGYGSDVYGLGSSGYGYGSNLYGAAAYGSFDDPGLMDAGFDPGIEDPGMIDAGFEDPGFVDPGFDAGMMDVGMDPGVIDAGMDAGFVDPGFDAGMVDVGGFDAGIGMDVGGGIEGMVF